MSKSSKDFPHPLNTFVEEEIDIPVTKPIINEKKKRVEFIQGTEKATQKTYYSDSKPKKIICGKNHVYECLDKGKYLFKCINCDWHHYFFPIAYKFNSKTGVVTYRKTGKRA